ncbi:MAG: ChaN family lipoprotein [Saprospiraceae bacterium]|nr:ChaN family lipoprotein [Saprospiraceae bacterium]MCB9325088.1 ChaN family lipoprotein [Lewinellaceae bacterium]
MTHKTMLVLLAVIVSTTLFGQKKPAYQIFNSKEKKAGYEKMLDACEGADVVFFGESHNNPISHWLQLELTKDLYEKKNGNLTLGAEMYESDGQIILDEYFSGAINQSSFEKEMRLWPNYKTDYKPVLEFAKEKGVKMIATNIPRRYANLVFRNGLIALDSLSDEAKKYIAPLPITVDLELEAYKSLMDMDMGGHGGSSENFPYSQAVKDATMGYFIYKNLEVGKTFIHYNGSYHSDNFQSILWYLNELNPKLKVVTITTVEQDDISELSEENEGTANFIICVPNSMTKTY